jgi:hypothetical protein
MNVSYESKAIKRNARVQKNSNPTAISSKKIQIRKQASKRKRNAAEKRLEKQPDLSSPQEDTDVKIKIHVTTMIRLK